ncbi:MAG: hypothetical protein NT103_07405 [Campylobacterales bacterium]|nr:hypothetical protein [Campylobacterales bacterium]
MESNAQLRDYDKDPIVIEDYNYIFYPLFIGWAALLVLYWFISDMSIINEITQRYRFFHFIIVIFIPMIFLIIQMKKQKRIIRCNNTEISYFENEKVIERISLDSIETVQRTFNDYYIKNQQSEGLFYVVVILLSPIYLIILVINKFLFHAITDFFRSYKLFDAIMIFDNKGNFINILPTKYREYKELEIYFTEKSISDINNATTFIKFDYKEEEKAK